MISLLIMFIISAGLVVFAGVRLSKYGDLIAARTGIGHFLVGGVLIAGVTSLPEVVTSSTAVVLGATDLAVGNLFGSNLFNILIIAIIDIYYRTRPLLRVVDNRHILSAIISILLSSLAIFFIIAHSLIEINILFFGIGLGSILIFSVYIFGTRLLFRYQKKNSQIIDNILLAEKIDLFSGVIYFLISAVIIIFSAIVLSYSAEKIAVLTGIGESFVGSVLVAGVTSLPELVIALTALKIGAYDMIIANVFGSNIFNMAIILVIDLIYQEDAILSAVSTVNSLTAILGIILSIIAILGLFYRSDKALLKVGWDSIAIIVTYILGVYLLLQIGIII